jgi:bifunctional non-homologous end joining protein LigD
VGSLQWPVAPMKATLGSLPHDDGGWAYELKWDGWRVIAHVADGAVRLQSISGIDLTDSFPELAGMGAAVNARRAILDGELVVLDDDGRPNFGMLQARSRPALFAAFDVLAVNDADTTTLPYEQRRRLLTGVLETGTHWTTPEHHIGGGADLLAITDAQGLEGIVAKRLSSVYRPGTRSKDWIKIKHRRTTELVVGGWRAGTGNRSSTFGALLVGVPTADGRLRFAGGVGTGFSQVTLEQLRRRLDDLGAVECPFDPPPPAGEARHATWVRPELRISAEIAEFTNDGHVRHASFVSLVDPPS